MRKRGEAEMCRFVREQRGPRVAAGEGDLLAGPWAGRGGLSLDLMPRVHFLFDDGI